MAKKKQKSQSNIQKAFPFSAEIIKGAAERLKSELESEEFIKILFRENLCEVLDISYFDETNIKLQKFNNWAKKYYDSAMQYCIDLRRELIIEVSPLKKIIKVLHYPYRLCPILKTGALEDKWVQKGIKVIRLLLIDKSIPIKIRKGLKNILESIFVSMIPNLKGQKDKPLNNTLLSEYEIELRRLADRVHKSYRNLNTKKLTLKDLYPKDKYSFISERLLTKFQDLSKREIAQYILAYKYSREPSVIRDWIAEAKKKDKEINLLFRYLIKFGKPVF